MLSCGSLLLTLSLINVFVQGYDIQTLLTKMELYEANEKVMMSEIIRLSQEITEIRLNEKSQKIEITNLKLWKETQNLNKRRLLPTTYPDSGVAFSAYKSSSFNARTFGEQREMVYDKTECNVGNSYSTSTGIFTAPLSGTYAFTWTTCAKGDAISVGIELVINNMVHGLVWTESQSKGEEKCSSGFVIHTLNTGDAVFTRSQPHGSIGTISSDQYTRTTFSGWLLFK